MQHTYLRYECADAFSLTCSSGSTPSAPRSSSILAFLDGIWNDKRNCPLLSVAGSQLIGWDLRRGEPLLKIGHREVLSGGIGTGRALNSSQVVCLDVSAHHGGEEDVRVATGWADGSVRVFSLEPNEVARFSSYGRSVDAERNGLVHSLIHGGDKNCFLGSNDEFTCREPLVLNGHGNSPVQMVVFDKNGGSVGRLASGGADGVVILWDVIAETGLFRLLGHRGPVTGISFVRAPTKRLSDLDGLVTSGFDGLVKVWDLRGQCCVQTLTGHRGGVGCLDCSILHPHDRGGGLGHDKKGRCRLITGCADGQVRVWSARDFDGEYDLKDADMLENNSDQAAAASGDEIFHYIGSLHPPRNLNMISSNNEEVAAIHIHPSGGSVGVCRTNNRVIEIYTVRTEVEMQKKRRRRLRRRREKKNLAASSDKGSTKKRGLLDDSESDEEEGDEAANGTSFLNLSPDAIKTMDEFDFLGTIRSGHKIRGFAFVPSGEFGGGTRVVAALATNALEIHSLPRPQLRSRGLPVTAERVSALDMYGHPTGIRSVSLSSDDTTGCTVSRGVVKIWNVENRSCLRSLTAAEGGSKGTSYYCLCSAFLPGNTHVVLGTREGHLVIFDVASGVIVHMEENAHNGAIWSLDLYHPSAGVDAMPLVTGSADKLVKYWAIEHQERENSHHPMVEHTRSLQMSDDVMCVRFSHSTDCSKRLLFVATLDLTIKVFFDDSLKFFLSLYGHKLPVLSFDSSSDDTILASGGADKSIKIWGLDFGDTHKTLYGHEDSVTDLRFVKHTHYFFTCSKDQTVRYWDADRFQQILLLRGHASEVNCLAVSSNGAFVLSGGMDRQVRVWERTKDIVFPQEERERELEKMFDEVRGSKSDENTTEALMKAQKAIGEDLEIGDGNAGEKPQSEVAVKQSIASVSSGDRIMEAVEMADKESKEIAAFKKLQEENGGDGTRAPNPMLFEMDPHSYVLWALHSVKSVDLEQSLLVLSLKHIERLMHYLILNLQQCKGVELCVRVSVFLIKAHQAQIVSNHTMVAPLRVLQSLVRKRTTEILDIVGFNLAAIRMVNRIAAEKKKGQSTYPEPMNQIWGEPGKIATSSK